MKTGRGRALAGGLAGILVTGIAAAGPLTGPTKVTVDKEGRLVLNGRPFFPIGLYSVPKDKLEHARQLGFNTVHTYSGEGSAKKDTAASPEKMKVWLDEAAKLGLYAWVGLPRHQIKTKQLGRLADRVKLLKDSPSLLFWYLFDEPKLQGVSADAMMAIADKVREVDPDHPRILAPYRNPKGYLEIPDVLMTWAYSVRAKNSDLRPVGKQIRTMRRLVADKKPVWSVIQLHGKGPGGKGYGYLEPNLAQVRNMTYQAIAAGCRALTFFTYRGSQFNLEESKQGQKNARQITSELRTLTPILLGAHPKSPPYTVGGANLQRTFLARDGRLYLLVVNTSYGAAKVTVSARGVALPAEVARVLGHDKVKTDGATFSESIEALGVRWYELPSPGGK